MSRLADIRRVAAVEWLRSGGCAVCLGLGHRVQAATCCAVEARVAAGLSPMIGIEAIRKWAKNSRAVSDWQVDFERLVGKAGDTLETSRTVLGDFRMCRLFATDTATPSGSGTMIELEKSSSVARGASAAFGTDGFNNHTGATVRAGDKITIRVHFLQACTFVASIFGQMLTVAPDDSVAAVVVSEWRMVLRDAWLEAGGCETCGGLGRRLLSGKRCACDAESRESLGIDPALTRNDLLAWCKTVEVRS